MEGIGPDQFLQVLSPVDQEKYQSGLPKLDRDDPKFCWVFENMDFEQWCLANSQVLWLTGPPECGTHEVASHIVDLARSQDSETQPIVFYFFCSTVTGTKSIMAAFIHALLQQLISYSSPLKKISVITAFLCTLLDTVICRDSDADADLWRLIKNPDCSPELKIRKILDVSSVNGHWHANAIKQILHIEQEQGLTIIIDGLDEAKDQKTGFIKEICGFITHLKQQTCKFKVLLTSQPQIEIKALLEGLSCIEYDIERKGSVLLCIFSTSS